MKQSEVSKNLMEEALLRLMQTKQYSDITIKDITGKAGVSRLTFYRNFENKNQILEHHIMAGFSDYMNSLKACEYLDLRNEIICCFRFWNTRSAEIRILIQQGLSTLLLKPFEECLYTVLLQIGQESNLSYFQKYFIIGGMFSDMLAWIEDPQGCSPERIADEIMALVTNH